MKSSGKMKMLIGCMFIALMGMGGVHCDDQDFHCDFKAQTWCGITQSKDDDFDWKLQSGRTPSGSKGTGPDKAHSGQYYVYAEVSRPRVEGDKAAFVLPHPKSTGKYSLEFHYVMYGRHVRKLSVLKDTQVVWSHDRDRKSSSWIKVKVSMELTKDNTITFVAEKGKGYLGDIAIDEISLKKVVGNPTTTVRTPTKTNNQVSVASQFFCGFEDKSWCGITQAKDDYFDWGISSGPSVSGMADKSGARVAYSGKYFALMNPNGQWRGDTAAINLPIWDSEGDYCLSFVYNNFGSVASSLSVLVNKKEAWKDKGKQHMAINDELYQFIREWRPKVVRLSLKDGDQVSFLADDLYPKSEHRLTKMTREFNWFYFPARIALDDVSLTLCDASHDKMEQEYKASYEQRKKDALSNRTCDFNRGDVCQLQQPSEGLTWKVRASGHEWDTGPSMPGRFYMSLDTKQKHRVKDGMEANLFTQIITTPARYCISFWFRMTGTPVTQSELIVTCGRDKYTPIKIWSHSQPTGGKWVKIELAYNLQKLNYDILCIRGKVRNAQHLDNLHIDNVSINPCTDQGNGKKMVTTPAPTALPKPTAHLSADGSGKVRNFKCDFENGEWCGVKKSGIGNWVMTNGGPTPPKSSYSSASKKFIVFRSGLSWLSLPTVNADTSFCFGFRYFADVSRITVFVNDKQVWTLKGEKSATWKQKWIQHNQKSSANVVMRFKVQNLSFKSFCALDDLIVKSENC